MSIAKYALQAAMEYAEKREMDCERERQELIREIQASYKNSVALGKEIERLTQLTETLTKQIQGIRAAAAPQEKTVQMMNDVLGANMQPDRASHPATQGDMPSMQDAELRNPIKKPCPACGEYHNS